MMRMSHLLLMGMLFGTAVRAEEPPAFLLKWGVQGIGDGEFDTPGGLAVDSNGNVYVADYLNHRVQKFTSEGAFLTKWGTEGFRDGQLSLPDGIAIDSRGVIYVTEYGNERVQKFSTEGGFLGYLTDWGPLKPGSVAVDKDDNVYVTGPHVHRVFKFASTGSIMTSWGAQGTGDGQFELPSGIAVDASGQVYVADSINDCIQKFTSDGLFLSKWTDADLYEPPGVAVDDNGDVYATSSQGRVIKFSSAGTRLSAWGMPGFEAGEFIYPNGIAVAGRVIYVGESGNHRIQKFGYPIAVELRTWSQIKAMHR
jgi:DNA-binding beta-propeller fold protein YncE